MGDQALKEAEVSNSFFSPMDVDAFFFAQSQRHGRQKGEDVVQKLSVSLEELYVGSAQVMQVERNVICKKCGGKGGEKRAFEKCQTCQGEGLQVQINDSQSDMIEVLSVCNYCGGEGERINQKDSCTDCKGKKVVSEKIILVVDVDKGMVDGNTIVYAGEGNQEPQLEPGDLVFVLNEMEHNTYKRSGSDLILQLKIESVEALCGFEKIIETLDKRSLRITSIPGRVLKHGDVKCVLNEGMPQYEKPLEKGRMIIQFLVYDKFPTNKIAKLESCLPAGLVETIPEIVKIVEVVSIIDELGSDYEYRSSEEDSSDED